MPSILLTQTHLPDDLSSASFCRVSPQGRRTWSSSSLCVTPSTTPGPSRGTTTASALCCLPCQLPWGSVEVARWCPGHTAGSDANWQTDCTAVAVGSILNDPHELNNAAQNTSELTSACLSFLAYSGDNSRTSEFWTPCVDIQQPITPQVLTCSIGAEPQDPLSTFLPEGSS